MACRFDKFIDPPKTRTTRSWRAAFYDRQPDGPGPGHNHSPIRYRKHGRATQKMSRKGKMIFRATVFRVCCPCVVRAKSVCTVQYEVGPALHAPHPHDTAPPTPQPEFLVDNSNDSRRVFISPSRKEAKKHVGSIS
jgi:hypothetical protein